MQLEEQIKKEVTALNQRLQDYSPNDTAFKADIQNNWSRLLLCTTQLNGQLIGHRKKLVVSILDDLRRALRKNFLDAETRDNLAYKCDTYLAICEFNLDNLTYQ